MFSNVVDKNFIINTDDSSEVSIMDSVNSTAKIVNRIAVLEEQSVIRIGQIETSVDNLTTQTTKTSKSVNRLVIVLWVVVPLLLALIFRNEIIGLAQVWQVALFGALWSIFLLFIDRKYLRKPTKSETS